MELDEIGKIISQTRKQRKLTQTQLGDRTGLSRTTISGIENNSVPDIGIRKLLTVCAELGLQLSVEKKQARPTMQQLMKERKNA